MQISSSINVGQTAAGAVKLAKAKRGRQKGAKNRKAPDWANTYAAASAIRDIGVYEQWGRQIGVERIDEADQTRRTTVSFAMLAIRDREVDAGGIVKTEAAENECEHAALDPLRKAGVFDDPNEPRRAKWRVDAGIELVRLGLEGKVFSRCTAAWRIVGGGGGGGISAEAAEDHAALCEMKYHNALDAVGVDLKWMTRSVCVDGVVPTGTKRRQLVTALDLLGEYLLHTPVPHDIIRPRLRVRDRKRPA